MMKRYCMLIALFTLMGQKSIHGCETTTKHLEIEGLLNDKTPFPEKDPELGVYWTLNKKGAAFPPDDPISASFFQDIIQYKAIPDVLEIGPAYGTCAANICAQKHINYTVVDADYRHLALATKAMQEKAIHTITSNSWHPYLGKFPEIEFDRGKFSHIGLFHLWHFLTPAESDIGIQKLEQLLQPDGKAYIYTAHYRTKAYGYLVPLVYNLRYYSGYQYPGYIADTTSFATFAVKCGFMPRPSSPKIEAKNNTKSSFMFLDTQELAQKIENTTSLIVDFASTIECSKYSKIPKTYVGIIARKPQQQLSLYK